MKMMKKWKKLFACCLSLTIAATATACGGNAATDADAGAEVSGAEAVESVVEETSESAAEGTSEIAEKEPITISILLPQNNALRSAMDTTKVWDYIEENTGIHFEIEVLQSSEQLAGIFASRDYPDVMARVGVTADQLATAAEAGDVVKLDDYFDTTLSGWGDFFEEYPNVYRIEQVYDGLYSLPWAMLGHYERGLHTQWLYNDVWLQELDLEVPTTIAEFTDVLRAVKAAAGTGTIPEDVIPFYFQFGAANMMNVFRTFGMPVTESTWLYVDEAGEVVSASVDPKMKDALKWLTELYAEGLIPPEVMTDDANASLVKVASDPPQVFCHTAFSNTAVNNLPMAPLDPGTGEKAYVVNRPFTQNNTYCCIVFNNDSEKVERILEFLDWAMNDEVMLTINYGLEGVVWDYTEDGKYQLNFWEESPELMAENAESLGLLNSWFGAFGSKFYENYYYPDAEVENTREWAIDNIYADYLPSWDSTYISAQLDADDQTLMNQLYTDLNGCRNETFARWITGQGDIDAEWDAYVAEMEAYGHSEWLELKQKAYDKATGR
ncbi:MAG: extracellular solute-binding protein [Lachnospiraceae bacterium]|nr:extracellular solute-binding protein [Lachnospiraceae bacterium]